MKLKQLLQNKDDFVIMENKAGMHKTITTYAAQLGLSCKTERYLAISNMDVTKQMNIIKVHSIENN